MSNKAYLYRLYPTKEQEILFSKTFGCCRKIYNLMLSDKKAYYEKTGKSLSVTPVAYKAAYPYLREVDALALTSEWMHLKSAYDNFFSNKNFGFPKFKSKHKDKNSYTTNLVNGNIIVGENWLKLPKLGRVPARIHRKPPENYVLKSVTVTRKRDGTYHAAVLYEYDSNAVSVAISPEMSHIGLDYKSDGLFVASDGTRAEMPHFFRKAEKKLARMQRKLSHKIESHVVSRDKKGKQEYDRQLSECRNVQKLRARVAKLHFHVANCRKDFLHKTSARITNSYDLVSVEDLDLKAMANKGFHNGKATMDNDYGMFLSMLAYKQRDKGHFLVKIGKWFPSSQLCHSCGGKNPDVRDLHVRKWECPICGASHDRDENAAINVDNEGLRLLLSGKLEIVGQELPDRPTVMLSENPDSCAVRTRACGVFGKAAGHASVGITEVCESGSSHILAAMRRRWE